MVRERVGDWRSAWRFALAGFLVVATSQTAVVAPLFYGRRQKAQSPVAATTQDGA
jgi:hypothetical protein